MNRRFATDFLIRADGADIFKEEQTLALRNGPVSEQVERQARAVLRNTRQCMALNQK